MDNISMSAFGGSFDDPRRFVTFFVSYGWYQERSGDFVPVADR
jgi:hypothetical protein